MFYLHSQQAQRQDNKELNNLSLSLSLNQNKLVNVVGYVIFIVGVWIFETQCK